MNNKIILILLSIILVLALVYPRNKETYDNFERNYARFVEDEELFGFNPKHQPVQRYLGQTKYLYPITNNKYCEPRGLKSANPPEICCNRHRCDYKANCRCKNKQTGECEVCFKNIPIAP